MRCSIFNRAQCTRAEISETSRVPRFNSYSRSSTPTVIGLPSSRAGLKASRTALAKSASTLSTKSNSPPIPLFCIARRCPWEAGLSGVPLRYSHFKFGRFTRTEISETPVPLRFSVSKFVRFARAEISETPVLERFSDSNFVRFARAEISETPVPPRYSTSKFVACCRPVRSAISSDTHRERLLNSRITASVRRGLSLNSEFLRIADFNAASGMWISLSSSSSYSTLTRSTLTCLNPTHLFPSCRFKRCV